MSEYLPKSPNDKGPDDPFATPEGEAYMAHAELDELLTMWMKFHPGVDETDVDAAVERFREAIRRRDNPEADEPQR